MNLIEKKYLFLNERNVLQFVNYAENRLVSFGGICYAFITWIDFFNWRPDVSQVIVRLRYACPDISGNLIMLCLALSELWLSLIFWLAMIFFVIVFI